MGNKQLVLFDLESLKRERWSTEGIAGFDCKNNQCIFEGKEVDCYSCSRSVPVFTSEKREEKIKETIKNLSVSEDLENEEMVVHYELVLHRNGVFNLDNYL